MRISDRSDQPLSDEEVAELDSFGELRGLMLLGVVPAPARALRLWEREILYGRVTPQPGRDGILKFATRK